ncbi:MAG: heavy-metal-associated domain-containing protein [Gemmatimonadaceae bacterium]
MEAIPMKTIAIYALIGTAGALSICDLCGPASVSAASPLARTALSAGGRKPAGTRLAPVTDTTVTFTVEGMTCGGCALGVRKVLTRLDGVTKAEVDLEKKHAVVTFDPSRVTTDQMIAAIKKLGFAATVVES